MSYALIGDIHSMGQQLSEALDICKERGLTPVFLGDIFDSRAETSETLYVYHRLKLAEKEMGAIILNSNHQDRFMEFAKGNTESPVYTSETWRTMDEFDEAGVELSAVSEWLSQFPEGFIFKSSNGTEYRCAHAYFPTDFRGKIDADGYCYAEDDEQKEMMLWGLMTPTHRRRVRWWHDDTQRTWVRAAGHYHCVEAYGKNLVLDANCGFDGGELAIYDVDAEELILIPHLTNGDA